MGCCGSSICFWRILGGGLAGMPAMFPEEAAGGFEGFCDGAVERAVGWGRRGFLFFNNEQPLDPAA